MRLLLILIVVALIIYIVKSALNRPAKRHTDRSGDGEPMVSCCQCSLHVPHSEALASDGRFFCSETHRRQWRDSQAGGHD